MHFEHRLNTTLMLMFTANVNHCMLLNVLPIDGTLTPQVTTTNNMKEAVEDYACIFVENETSKNDLINT